MNLLLVIPEFPPQYGGGIATYYEALIPAMAAEGHEVDVMVGSAFTKDSPRREQDGYSVEFLDLDRRRRATEKYTAYEAVPSLRRTLAAAWALYQQSDGGEGYDVVETTDFGLTFLPWIVADDTPPVLVQLHASNGQVDAHEPKEGQALQGHLTRLLEMQGLSHADGLQSNGRHNAQAWSERLGRDVWYGPPPLSQSTDARHGSSPKNVEAEGFVAGRIQYWKGPTVLCEAQAHLSTDAPQIDWAGRDTNYRSAGSSMSDYLDETYPDVWRESVRPVGEIPPDRVAIRQAAAEFVVVPSLWDVFNYTAVEAMRAGSVVVCSEGAGAAELITHGQNGLTVPAGDAEALAEAIQTASHLPNKRQQSIERAAQETVRKELSPQAIARDRADVYRRTQRREASTSVPAWLTEAVKPDGEFEVSSRPLAFLDELSAWDIGRYMVRRTWKKLRPFG
jgi:glycosyltransferase involved in cell wall biosynthesis